MAEFIKNLNDQKDILETIEKIKKLQAQRQSPDRNGMIDALQDAKNKAPLAITALELSQGDTHWMPFANFSDADLYRKLSQYQQGLEAYCIEKGMPCRNGVIHNARCHNRRRSNSRCWLTCNKRCASMDYCYRSPC